MIKRVLRTFLVLAAGLSIHCGAAASTIIYYHNDLLGSPAVATDASGNVVWRESYRPYGERLVNSAAATGNQIWFTGRRQDPETGLVYMGARYYDPITGRFVSTDPKMFDPSSVMSFNRYAYANDNPYRYLDPNGKWSTEVHHEIIDAAFTNWSSRERAWLKVGSDKIDAWPNQIPGMGKSYEHAMRDPGQSRGDAEQKMWAFVELKIGDYNHYLYDENDEARAWEALGEALHPIMDSTSPAHEGFQIWRLDDGTWEWHGDFGPSLENKISPEVLHKTIDLMQRVMNGERRLDN